MPFLIIFLLFASSSFLGDIEIPKGQPKQIQSAVTIDSKIDNPFFRSNAWSYPDFMIPAQAGYFENAETGETVMEKEVPRIKHTAKCISTNRGEHALRYCAAKLNADHSITLYFHEFSPAFYDNLVVTISGSQFQSQFWTVSLIRREGDLYVWTTTKQTLILDKKEYRPGDMLKGRIEFKCVENNLNPKHKENDVITVRGVFKTVLQ